jgi:hypothetical protein
MRKPAEASLDATTESIHAYLICEGQEEKGTYQNKSHFYHKQHKGTQPSRQVPVAASTRKFDSSKVQWEKCPSYKYILKMHPPFSKSLLPMAILQINNRTFVNAKNIFF